MTIYDFTVLDQHGNEVSLREFEGKVLLIVNTATRCGFTKQYTALEELYKKYNQDGFEILDFPCNQFAGQAREPINEICEIRTSKYGVNFRLFDKIKVNGKEAHPLYNFLKKEKPMEDGVEKIKWNFTKFLIDREGNIVERFGSRVKPEEIDSFIAELVKK